eukprot:761961-Hanusia_phi.AAC.3
MSATQWQLAHLRHIGLERIPRIRLLLDIFDQLLAVLGPTVLLGSELSLDSGPELGVGVVRNRQELQ